MPVLDEILALDLADRGERLAPLDRAVLLASALGGIAPGEAADLPLDRRDRLLIDARLAAFGAYIGIFARCPHCSEGNEAEFDLRALPPAADERSRRASIGGHEVVLRAPTSREVGAAALADDPAILRSACVDAASGEIDGAAIEAALGESFPLLDVRIDMACSGCAAIFGARFDIVPWLWSEVEGLAARAIAAVDRLARAYGWSERAILALSPARRARYLARALQ